MCIFLILTFCILQCHAEHFGASGCRRDRYRGRGLCLRPWEERLCKSRTVDTWGCRRAPWSGYHALNSSYYHHSCHTSIFVADKNVEGAVMFQCASCTESSWGQAPMSCRRSLSTRATTNWRTEATLSASLWVETAAALKPHLQSWRAGGSRVGMKSTNGRRGLNFFALAASHFT